MIINAVSHYLPEELVPNEYFTELTGLSHDHIVQRTGIITRTKAAAHENTNTMSIEAVKLALDKLPYPIEEIDLIVGATYTPFDTVGTLAHVVQKEFNITNAKVISVSSACSSFVNAAEIVEGYFAMNKASKALIVATEHNTAYTNEDDITSGHLWGDGAATAFISRERFSPEDIEILDIETFGLAHIDKGPEGVYVRPRAGGTVMPDGKNVFINACKYMEANTKSILSRNGYSIKELDYFVAHQANKRIIDNVANRLGLNNGQAVSNIEQLGNTGCASCWIAFSQTWDKFKTDDIIVISVFGGGYSSGAMLLKK